EGFNFDARKHVLEFDDVLNFQRSIIYEKRKKVLAGAEEDIRDYLLEIGRGLDEEAKKKFDEKLADGRAFEPVVLGVWKRIILQTIDLFWVDHLEMMEYL